MNSDDEGKKSTYTIKTVHGKRSLMKRRRKLCIKKSTYREFKNEKKDACVVNF